MKNEDALKDPFEPMDYLEMLFGRYVHESLDLDLEFRRVTYFSFMELVTGFTAIGVFADRDQCMKAHAMCDRLKILLDLNFDDE